jgi:hypothetical protein
LRRPIGARQTHAAIFHDFISIVRLKSLRCSVLKSREQTGYEYLKCYSVIERLWHGATFKLTCVVCSIAYAARSNTININFELYLNSCSNFETACHFRLLGSSLSRTMIKKLAISELLIETCYFNITLPQLFN